MIQQPTYHLKGAVLGGCNCEWGCPCNFEMPLSQGFGEGEYVGSLEQGKYEGVRLDGLNFGMFGHSPAAIHLGNLTTAVIVDVRANPEQKAALASMLTKVVPFGIFMDRTSNFLGIRYEELEVPLGGIHSRITIPEVYELCLTPMTNPVTGEPELVISHKPTGFTSKIQELCATTVERVTIKALASRPADGTGSSRPSSTKIADLKDSLAFDDEPVLQSGLTGDRPMLT